MQQARQRHILSISGGKDSSALAVYMRDRVPEMEYVFCDTGKELAETYEYLGRLEAFLGKPIERLNPGRGFDHWLTMYDGYLPSPRMRWCTRQLKIKPFEAFVGDDPVVSYIGIRADEDREGYISHKPNITPRYPFKEDGLVKADVYRILEESGVGLPTYYEWRTRSGCFFCFFQRKAEWIGLLERHPDLYEQAEAYEKELEDGTLYTWSQGETLQQLADRKEEVLERHQRELAREAESKPKHLPLAEALSEVLDAEDDEEACFICSL